MCKAKFPKVYVLTTALICFVMDVKLKQPGGMTASNGFNTQLELLIIRIFGASNIRTTFSPFHEYSNNYSNIFM